MLWIAPLCAATETAEVPAFPKILVVDSGARTADHALSADLAELGYASVTTSLEAADDVLAAIRPAAILLQPPRPGAGPERDRFLAAAERLRSWTDQAGVPIVLLDGPLPSAPGAVVSALGEWSGPRVLNRPEL